MGKSHKKIERHLCTFDVETDPFLFGRKPEPFCVNLYDGHRHKTFWGVDCMAQFSSYLRSSEPLLLYAHNGGKFDFFYLLPELQEPLHIINGRIVVAGIRGTAHRLRDSYAILPIPLRASGAKLPIDFELFTEDNREGARNEIIAYNRQDCVALYDAVEAFRARFGDKRTIGSAAIAELGRYHEVSRLGESHDAKFRPYFSGGRVENFRHGVLRGEWKCYDVNSMYPYVMACFSHPVGAEYAIHTDMERALRGPAPFFATIDATSRGAFMARPTRAEETCSFPHQTARFHVTGYELRAALDLGLVDVHNVAIIYEAARWQNFNAFVGTWYAEKKAHEGDRASPSYLHAKLILNSAYGKFGSNPNNYYDYKLYDGTGFWPGAEWSPYADYGNRLLLRAPVRDRVGSFFDVAAAASITGAARSVLLRGLADSVTPVYCDTDSIISEGFTNQRVGAGLGDWKLEATGDTIALAGKKLYALSEKGVVTKKAHKGVNLTAAQIFDLARGNSVESFRDAPCFSLARPNGTFTHRRLEGKTA